MRILRDIRWVLIGPIIGVLIAFAGNSVGVAQDSTPVIDWNRLGVCRSGGIVNHPPIRMNESRILYSGLYLIPQITWKAYGGLQYAPVPHKASRNQQTTVIKRMVADPETGGYEEAQRLATCDPAEMTTQVGGS